VPSLIVCLAENQQEIAKNLFISGAAALLSVGNQLSSSLQLAIRKILSGSLSLQQMSIKAADLVPSSGTSQIISEMEHYLK
jgi:spore coat polysaccharide biosynthesis predicted glycosyltransferase SpsG